jgi:hypothetical protein
MLTNTFFKTRTDGKELSNSSMVGRSSETEFTVSLWGFPSGLTQSYGQGIYTINGSFYNTNDPGGIFRIFIFPGGGVKVQTGAGGLGGQLILANADSPIQMNKWFHLMLVLENNTLNIFVNGQDKTSLATVTGTISTMPSLQTGAVKNYMLGYYNSTTYSWQGSMAHLAQWDSDKSSDISTIYNNGQPGDLTSLSPKNWWKLTDGSLVDSGSEADNAAALSTLPTIAATNINSNLNTGASSGMTERNLVNDNVSVLNGESEGMNSTNLVQSNLTRTQPYSNYSFNFDGATNDYIDCTDADIFSFGDGTNDSPFSISAWIKTTVGTGKGIISKWGSDGYEWIFWVVGPNKIRVNLNDNTNLVYQFRQGNTDVNTGEWVHAIVTYDGRGGDGSLSNTANQGIKIYINGVEESSYTDGNNPTGSGYVAMHNTVRRVQIAGYNSVGQFDGQISNAAIFNKVLNEDEILNIYNNGVPQDLQTTSTFSGNIVAWWPMDQRSSYFDGTDWVVRDLENGNDGDGANTSNVEDMFGNAPGSDANGSGTNLAIADLKGNMYNSDKNAYSINMADYADGVTNPANSGRSTDTP